MKKIVFKWVTTVIDYTSEVEARRDIQKLREKGYRVQREQWTANSTFEEQGQKDKCYTVEYISPYNDKYNTGF